jgi:proline iminopeptidase
VVLFDQRGCGRSLPNAGEDLRALDNNTTAHLVADMEALREHLNIDRWLLFGASWGSTLGLSYAVEHPEHVTELVLWALVTTRAKDVHWLTHVMGDVYPEEFDRLLSIIPASARSGNIATAVHALLRSDDPEVRDGAALAWCSWEDRLATLNGPVTTSRTQQDPIARLGFSRIVTHYFGNYAFQADDAITSRLGRIAHLPAYLLRGRLDIASPLRSAYEIAYKLPHATLDIVEADAHGAGDDTSERLIETLDRLGALTNQKDQAGR